MDLHIDPKLLIDNPVKTPAVGRKDDSEALRRSCQEFEAHFLQAMFKGMRASIPEGGLFEKGLDREVFEELQDQEVARKMAQGQGVGLAEALFQQLRMEKP